jgi:hypothetical protein
MILGALRRLAVAALLAAAVAAAGSLLIGGLLGASLTRSLSMGFYIVGCFLLVSGFFVGNRGPIRIESETAGGPVTPLTMFGARKLRWATLGEQNESIGNSAVFIVLGFVLVIVGVVIDSRHSLF